MGHKQISFK